MVMPPSDSRSPDAGGRDDAPVRDAPVREDLDRRHAERRTESQSAYIREQGRSDAEPGDASADVQEVRLRSNYRTRRGDSAATDDDGSGQACQSAFTRAEQQTLPTRNSDATR